MAFKDSLEFDLQHSFFCESDFAVEHLLNGIKTPIVVDNDKLQTYVARRVMDTDGIFSSSKMIYVREDAIDFEPVIDQYIDLDGESLRITDVGLDCGMYTIILEAYQS